MAVIANRELPQVGSHVKWFSRRANKYGEKLRTGVLLAYSWSQSKAVIRPDPGSGKTQAIVDAEAITAIPKPRVYPEHDRWQSLGFGRRIISDFMEWLEQRETFLGVRMQGRSTGDELQVTITWDMDLLLREYYNLDVAKYEAEEVEMAEEAQYVRDAL